jgi:alkanesulfonate monooxygenase SsuD/methylene tetrahydromethanopterin reductase-like flavin-dependent oxidoreductase (luciferase family)
MIDQFGVTVDWRGATIEGLTSISLQADYSGCGYLWVPEAWGLEAFSTLGRLLSITKRIRIGTGVANIYSRTAGTIGMACATLNQIAPGRFLLGLGISGKGLVESFHGVKFEKPFKRMQEYVEVIRKVESGGPVDYNGEILKLSKFRLFTAPAKQPVPIYLGAMGEKNLSLAGRIADGAIVTCYPLSKLGQCLDAVNQSDPSKKKRIFAFMHLRLVSNERDEAAAKLEVARFVSFYVASMGDYYAQNLKRLGFEKDVDEIRAAASSGGTAEAAKIVSEDFLKEFSLIGRPVEILARVADIPNNVHPVFVLDATSIKQADASARALREISASLANHKQRAI